MIACMINISTINYETQLTTASSVLSIIIVVFLALAIALETYVIREHRGSYHISDFKLSYGACIEGLNTDTLAGRYWNPLTMIRWAITNLIMIFLRDHCVAQIFVLMVISLIFQIKLIGSKPMTDKFNHRMAVVIEVSVSIYLYTLLSLTDFSGENKLRTELGWILAMLTGIVIGINVSLFLWKFYCKVFIFIKQILARYNVK
jgi:hypothetical protein